VVDVAPFWIDTAPVTNAEYAEFVAAGGYDDPRWWTAPGWRHRVDAGLSAPQSWRQDGSGEWFHRRFGLVEPVPGDEPVVHVCCHEADAYAAWAGKRLPTEAEWEKAARFDPATGRSRRFPWGDADPTPRHANLGQHHLQPAPVGAYPDGASPLGVEHLMGDVWEWTASGWHPYPGFEVFPYPEYSQVFFGGDYRVLRGGSFGTDPAAVRATFRNWDLPIRRQIFSGFRLARDARPGDGA
jgi:iron(II)-dependent oxidoreductase